MHLQIKIWSSVSILCLLCCAHIHVPQDTITTILQLAHSVLLRNNNNYDIISSDISIIVETEIGAFLSSLAFHGRVHSQATERRGYS